MEDFWKIIACLIAKILPERFIEWIFKPPKIKIYVFFILIFLISFIISVVIVCLGEMLLRKIDEILF